MIAKRLFAATGICALVVLMASAGPVLAQPEAICVDWVPSDPTVPHYLYSGAQTTLKGIARGDATEYYWDYGDGSPAMGWTAITNSYILEGVHTYAGLTGQTFVATLHVRNGAGDEDTDTYRVRLFTSTDLSDHAHLDVRINMSIDEGLWWLHKRMIRATFPAGAPGYGEPYGYMSESYTVDATAVAVDAFQLHGNRVNGDYDGDPYVETVQRGMNYMLTKTFDYTISVQAAGDPDTNGNGIGLVVNYTDNRTDHRQTYIGGIGMVTLASSGAPNRVASVGGAYVYGRTYAEIAQDMVDWFAYGQVDGGSGRGGWRYYGNYSGSDMSTAQWPPLGMLTAEERMMSTVPQFVRDELVHFLNYVYHENCDSLNGGYGYSVDINYPNCTKAAAGFISQQFLHVPLDRADMEATMGYLFRRWNDTGTCWDNTRVHGNSYGMYGIMKALRLPGEVSVYAPMNLPLGFEEITEYDCSVPDQTANSFDWYYSTNAGPREGLAHYIVRTQQADGSWDDTVGCNKVYDEFATSWRILILIKSVGVVRPVAEICHCDELTAEWDQPVTLDGECSYHPVEERSVVSYSWDFGFPACDGVYDDASGPQVVWPGASPTDSYCISLLVEDDNPDGALRDVLTCEILVHPPPHVPIADANGPYDGFIGVSTTLDACASWDPNANIETYSWDLDGDGEFDDCISLEPECTCEWTCPMPGEWGICVEVCDTALDGFPSTCDTDCTTIDCDNHPPVSDPNGPYGSPPNWTITLDGTGSYDPDPGDTIIYEWDLDGDGEYDDCFDATCPFMVGPDVDEVYDVCLKVTDSFGEHDIACTTVTVIQCPPNPDPLSQGYWHRQCLGLSEAEGGIDPGRNGRGPQDPTEPGFVEDLMPCSDDMLENLGFYMLRTCDGMDADPPSDQCEKAKKQLTALILNTCSQRLMVGCPADLAAYGCSATTIGGAINEIGDLILAGDCNVAKSCAAALNEGDGLVSAGGSSADEPQRSRPTDRPGVETGDPVDFEDTERTKTPRRSGRTAPVGGTRR